MKLKKGRSNRMKGGVTREGKGRGLVKCKRTEHRDVWRGRMKKAEKRG
jgi:hypothetical protein